MANPGSSRDADVVVIGGGVIGCSIALRLAQARLAVTVMDRGGPGAEASSAAAGMLAPQGEVTEPNDFFHLCSASRDLYPRFVDELEDLSGERLGYRRDGTLLVGISEEECRELDRIYNAQSRLGLPLERLSGDACRARIPGLASEIGAGLFIPGDHWVDNEQLCRALVKACRRLGVAFETSAVVTKLKAENGRLQSVEVSPALADGDPSRAGSAYAAATFVLAAGCWSRELAAGVGISLALKPCRGQMIQFDAPAELPLTVRLGLHYLVPRAPRQVLAGTTAEYVGYEKAVTEEGLRSIRAGTSRFAPLVNGLRFRRAWAGLRPDTADHLPILGYGEVANLIFATGHFRHGILLAPLTAQLVSELLLTRSTSWPIEAYHPGRFAAARRAP